MRIEILGTESLGVRGLCCIVHTHDRHIVIDPGVALGYQREGLLPHPIQVAAGEDVRNKIIKNLKNATDVVISHFHGDHIPLENANPYQLSLQSVADLLKSPRLWVKGIDGEKPHIADRRNKLLIAFEIPSPCDNQTHGMLSFSKTMPHGLPHLSMGTVMMTRIEKTDMTFLFMLLISSFFPTSRYRKFSIGNPQYFWSAGLHYIVTCLKMILVRYTDELSL
jgi:predicted metallo-beta-lactamase superfamily hydrolase